MRKDNTKSKNVKNPQNQNNSQAAIYQAFGDEQKIRVRIEDENVWLTQKLIAELFDVDIRTVNEHLANIYSEQELNDISTIRNFRIVQKEAGRQVERDIEQDKNYISDFDCEIKKLIESKNKNK